MPRVGAEQRAERDRMVLRMYLAGSSYGDIASHPAVRLSLGGVHQLLKRSVPASSRPVSEVAEIVYIERLETMLRAAWPQACQGQSQRH